MELNSYGAIIVSYYHLIFKGRKSKTMLDLDDPDAILSKSQIRVILQLHFSWSTKLDND